jgi:hypothetical protein
LYPLPTQWKMKSWFLKWQFTCPLRRQLTQYNIIKRLNKQTITSWTQQWRPHVSLSALVAELFHDGYGTSELASKSEANCCLPTSLLTCVTRSTLFTFCTYWQSFYKWIDQAFWNYPGNFKTTTGRVLLIWHEWSIVFRTSNIGILSIIVST